MIKKIVFILLAAIMLQNAAQAQEKNDQRTVTTRIADLLAQMPANDSKLLDNNIRDIAQLGEDGYLTLINKLAAPGKGNNALLEYTIGGFSAYVSRSKQENLRQMAVSAYCKALTQLTNKQNKSFIISQLDLVGKDDAIATLQTFLTDDFLADPASRALVKINTPASKAALLNALPKANGQAKLSIIDALGKSRNSEAASAINALATGNDENFTKIVLFALAHIADPSSESILANAAEKSGYKFENTNATADYIIYATQLLNDGNTALADKIGRKLLAKSASDDLVRVRTGALKILVEANKTNNQNLLLTAAGDKNTVYRAAALRFASPYVTSGNTAKWVKKMNQADDAAKIDIIYMLGESDAKEALPAILKLFKAKNQDVKLAALTAAANIGQQQVLPDLLKVMAEGDSLEIATIAKLIDRMKGDNVTEVVAAAIPNAKPEVQITLLNILAARAANAQINTVYGQLKSNQPEVQQAAYKALSRVVIAADLPKLFILLKNSDDAQEQAVQEAIIAAIKNVDKNTEQVDAVLAQMNSATPKKKLLFYKILANLGGAKSLNAVVNAYQSGNEQTKKASLEALAAWKDSNAAAELIKIARETNNASFLNIAINGYLLSIQNSIAPAEQKLLLLRNAMEVAKTAAQKNKILSATADAKCYKAILFAGKYLDDTDLQQAAANAVMDITMAGQYNGELIKGLLNKTIAVITGSDSGYQKEGMRKYIAEMKPGAGFTPLFNGTDLTGWKGLGAGAAMLQSWRVSNGELHFTGNNASLATIKKYGDFEMLMDWKAAGDKKGEAGAEVYLRGGTPLVITSKNARTNADEWNTFRILLKGDRLTVYLNGVLVTDNVILENYLDKNIPIATEGQIEFKPNGPVAYRDIYINELPQVKPYVLSAEEKKEGFKVLFDGTNMHNWTGNTTSYTIEDGIMTIRPKPGKGSGGNLYTKDEYSDFIFRFEFKLSPAANNGVGIRAPLEGDAAYVGMELQILDDDAPIYKDLHVYQYHGSIYGTIPAKRGYLKPVGEWNYEEIIAKGPKIKIILNGTTIIDADITEARKNGAADGKKHPGLLRDSGHIGFLGHGSFVQFKNIRVKDLSTGKK